MPIPTEMGLCMRMMRREKPEMPQEQRVAICLDAQRKAGKDKNKDKKDKKEKK